MITTVRHPFFKSKENEWEKWRLVFDGGQQYVNKYMEKFSKREDIFDFNRRKRISPTPNFAKSAIIDIKNSIFQRLVDVTRKGGSDNYQRSIKGLDFGVDLHGSSMNSFMGQDILTELITMSRVGVFVDMPQNIGPTLKAEIGQNPYLYRYKAEEILSWSFFPGRPDEFQTLLLKDFIEIKEIRTGLPEDTKERFRFLFLQEDQVHVQFFEQFIDDQDGKLKERQIDSLGNPTDQDLILDIPIIPFILVEISDSLLADVANHQIALLNMESSDILYTLLANFPFYTEQVDGRQYSKHLKTGAAGDDGTEAKAKNQNDSEITVGVAQGRTYPKDLDRPDFIHPSSEPLLASMKKQERLKDDIRTLVNLTLSSIKPKVASAESKNLDLQGLEAGLSNIGLILEKTERKIVRYWEMYDGSNKTATINYPESYSLKSDEDRRANTKQLKDLRLSVPSKTFQTEISKQMAIELLGTKLSNEQLTKIEEEIEAATLRVADFEIIFRAIEVGLLDKITAAELFGLPKEAVERATVEHAERLKLIAETQAPITGPGPEAKDQKKLSRNTDSDGVVTSKQRGKADGKSSI